MLLLHLLCRFLISCYLFLSYWLLSLQLISPWLFRLHFTSLAVPRKSVFEVDEEIISVLKRIVCMCKNVSAVNLIRESKMNYLEKTELNFYKEKGNNKYSSLHVFPRVRDQAMV